MSKFLFNLGVRICGCVYNYIHEMGSLSAIRIKHINFAFINYTIVDIEQERQSHKKMASGPFLVTAFQLFRTQFPPLEQIVSQNEYEKINT
jgi:hypothetical protein